MLYGINFTRRAPGTNSMGFPPNLKRAFPREMKFEGMTRGQHARLQAICTTADDAHNAVIQSDNGNRKIYVVKRNQGARILWGVYWW